MVLIRPKTLLLLILTCIHLPCLSAPVTLDAARAKANAFLQSTGRKISGHKTAKQHTDKGNTPLYFIFNIQNDGGFIIVSGDDATEEILGYTTKGRYDESHLPPNMSSWLDSRSEEIAAIRQSSGRNHHVNRNNSHEAISPLISTQWNQGVATTTGDTYNMLCPTIDSLHCVTGCVATAMAQLMRYHQWPSDSCRAIPGYENTSAGALEDLPSMKFDWVNMLDIYDGEANTTEKTAVATLMRYCGQAAVTKYGLRISEALGSDAANALRDYFDYSSTTRYVKRNDYNANVWDNMIYKELACSRPVIYFGYSSKGGHAFVCDGYDGNEFYHINWGWGGDYNGYFKLSALSPDGVGTGGGAADGYAMNQHAIIGITKKCMDSENIVFADEKVKAVCIDNWDSNGDGELSYEEAENVLSLDGVFSGDSIIKQFNELQFFTSIKSIGEDAFANCIKLESVEIPSYITSIGPKAFANCHKLLTLVIPEHVNTISPDAFVDCQSLNRIHVVSKNAYFDSRNDCDAIINSDEDKLVVGCMNTVIPSSVKSIGAFAFKGCRNLTTLEFPETIEEIEESAFELCGNLREITFPLSLSYIGPNAFSGCKMLTKITLPEQLAMIGNKAFSNCQNLATIYSMSTEPPTCGNDAFSGCRAVVYVPIGSKAAYQEAEEWKDLTIMEMKENDYLYCGNIAFTKTSHGRMVLSLHNSDAVIGLQFRLKLPEGIEISTNNSGKYNIKSSIRMEDHGVYCTKQNDGSYKILVMSMMMSEILGNDGEIMYIGIEVADSVPSGIYEAEFNDMTISIIENDIISGVHPLPFTSEIKLRDFDMGDVNGDSIINVTDVMMTVNYILGNVIEAFIEENADVDGSGEIDVTDVMRMVQIILMDDAEDVIYYINSQHTNHNMTLETMRPGTYQLRMDNTFGLTALQFLIHLPEGNNLSSVRLKATKEPHQQITWAECGENSYQVVVYSTDGMPLNTDGITTLEVSTTKDVKALDISRIFFTNEQFETFAADSMVVTIDGIQENTMQHVENNAYNLWGQRISDSYKGVVISNGKKHIRK